MSIRRADKRTEELELEIAEMEKGNLSPTPPKEEVKETESAANPPADVIELSPEEATWKKRHGDLRRHSQKLQDEIVELKQKLATSTQTVLPDTKEKMKEWANKNPQIAAIIRAIASEEADSVSGNITTQLEHVNKLKEEIERDKVEAKVKSFHKDFDNIVADKAFHDWAESQPSWVQDKIYDNLNAEDTIWAISLYKKEVGITNTKMEKDAAKLVEKPSRTSPSAERGKGRFTESMVERMTADEFDKNWEQIEKDMKHPEFYDRTAGAR